MKFNLKVLQFANALEEVIILSKKAVHIGYVVGNANRHLRSLHIHVLFGLHSVHYFDKT